jgi:hypothetical protein
MYIFCSRRLEKLKFTKDDPSLTGLEEMIAEENNLGERQ